MLGYLWRLVNLRICDTQPASHVLTLSSPFISTCPVPLLALVGAMDVYDYTTSNGGTGAKFKGYTTIIAGAASIIATVVSVLFVPRCHAPLNLPKLTWP